MGLAKFKNRASVDAHIASLAIPNGWTLDIRPPKMTGGRYWTVEMVEPPALVAPLTEAPIEHGAEFPAALWPGPDPTDPTEAPLSALANLGRTEALKRLHKVNLDRTGTFKRIDAPTVERVETIPPALAKFPTLTQVGCGNMDPTDPASGARDAMETADLEGLTVIPCDSDGPNDARPTHLRYYR